MDRQTDGQTIRQIDAKSNKQTDLVPNRTTYKLINGQNKD